MCGLLGPNGAGKTTCLRMLLGLIRPTAGETRLFGHRVTPGTDELRRLGALIESSAFVPHLSGMRNLKLWWEAGGGKWADADLEQALAIADLGSAIDRRVKTYSQGMRQRLGLARVLLGKPEVLVLDEPTNGLDPGEMREVRQLVRRVAEAGSTVLFSSHVLAEVEQICTHAVVMDKGKLVATGSVVDLIGAAGTVYLEVDDVALARGVLEGIPSVRRIEDEAPGLAVDDGRRTPLRPRRRTGRRRHRGRDGHRTPTPRGRVPRTGRGRVMLTLAMMRTELVKSLRRTRTVRRVRDPRADPDHHGGGDQPQPARRPRRGPPPRPRVTDRAAAARVRAARHQRASCS